MTFSRAKSAQSLYSDVRDYNLVLVPDAPLASAINRRVDRPQFGTFATTPRRVAAGRREPAEDRLAFLDIIADADATRNWKAIAYAIGNVLQCWEHRGHIDSILEYDAYADEVTRDVVEALGARRTTSQQLTECTIPAEQSVAVIGEEQFTQLERSILPAAYDSYSLFTTESFERPSFHVLQSASAIVSALVETITAETADNVAVVLDSSSRYSSLIESALEANDIPFYGGPGFSDDRDHRAYIQLLRAAFRGSGTTIGDLRPILARFDVAVDVDHDAKRLAAASLPGLEWLASLLDSIPETSFGGVLDAYEDHAGRSLPRLREELQELGLAGVPVTERRVDRLSFYLDAYEVPTDRENEGVLLADAKASGYVDRPAVFYLGLDEGWTHSAPQRPWVDADAQFTRYLSQFQRLLQSGTEQYYLVEDTSGGQAVTPCLYFNELLDEDFERFSDLESVSYGRQINAVEAPGFEKESIEVAAEHVDTISQTSLNTYVNSPREYYFQSLLDQPDRDYFREGNLLHDFAEFYVNHPDYVDTERIAEAVDVMCEEIRPFHPETETTLRRRKYRIGIEIIIEFLETNVPADGTFLTARSRRGRNFFADYFDRELEAPHTERWFENHELGVKGKIDLVHAPHQLLDYKSGNKKRDAKIVKRSAVDPPAETPNFQALLYLTHYRTVRPDAELEFTFFHFLETLDDVIAGEADLQETLTTITYHPVSFQTFVETRDAYETLLDGYNDCQETFADLGFDAYQEIMAALSFPATTEKAELRDSEFAAAFETAVEARTVASVDAAKGCDQAIRELNGVRKKSFFEEDLDAFEAFVDDQLTTLNARRRGDEQFPVAGPRGEVNYRRVDHRDLLVGGTTDE